MIKIDLENISHRFNLPGRKELTAIKDINLQVEAGEMVAIIGESGCGKTTLLNLVAGLIKPASGVVRIDNQRITGPHYSRVMMFQQPCVLPWLNVEENIAFGCILRGEKMPALGEKVDHYIRQIGLKGFEKAYPHNLSAGMLQRVALGRSLITEPEILLMDESFSDVDVFTRTNLRFLVLELWQELNLTILVVTHDIDEALLLGQRVILMGDRPGRIIHTFYLPLDFPRDPYDPHLQALKKEIMEYFNV